MAGLAATLVASTVLAALKPAQLVEIAGHEVRLSDVADLRGVDYQTAKVLGTRIVARLPDAGGTLQLSRADVQTLARRAVPMLRFGGVGGGSITFRGPPPSRENSAQNCVEVRSPIGAGQPISADDVGTTDCSSARTTSSIRFSQADRQVYAKEALQPGDYLGQVRLPEHPLITRGQQMTLRSAVGPVVIERPVTAMQNASASGRIFVKSGEGDVFAAPVAKEVAQ